MNEIAFYGILVINTIILTRNSYLIVTRRIKPSLAMWLFFTIAVVGSLFSYMLDGNYSPLDNILNTSDIVLCGSLSLVILFFGGKEARFNRFDLACLAVVLLILVYWFFSRAHFATNLSLQLIQAIAYFPVYNRMLKSRRNTESFLPWTLLFLASVLNFFSGNGQLAFIYSLRSTLCTASLLALMTWLEFGKRRLQREDMSGRSPKATMMNMGPL